VSENWQTRTLKKTKKPQLTSKKLLQLLVGGALGAGPVDVGLQHLRGHGHVGGIGALAGFNLASLEPVKCVMSIKKKSTGEKKAPQT
jgi:hypothetical protein